MNCWHCGTELIWGGDHDTEDNEDYDIVTNLSCPKCHTHVDVYYPSERLIKEYKDYDKKRKRKKIRRKSQEHLMKPTRMGGMKYILNRVLKKEVEIGRYRHSQVI